jgi:hypothetical protein
LAERTGFEIRDSALFRVIAADFFRFAISAESHRPMLTQIAEAVFVAMELRARAALGHFTVSAREMQRHQHNSR